MVDICDIFMLWVTTRTAHVLSPAGPRSSSVPPSGWFMPLGERRTAQGTPIRLRNTMELMEAGPCLPQALMVDKG